MNLIDVMKMSGPRTRRRRVGRGESSGKGKTSGRGHKGAHARAGFGGMLHKEGGQMPLWRRLPKRGFNNKNFRTEYAILNVQDIEEFFTSGEEVSPETAKARGVMKKRETLLKILGKGEIQTGFSVRAHRFSATAREKILAAGGTVIEIS